MFFTLQKAVLAARNEHRPAIPTLHSLVDKVGNAVFVGACEDHGYPLMRFLGPELQQEKDAKKVVS